MLLMNLHHIYTDLEPEAVKDWFLVYIPLPILKRRDNSLNVIVICHYLIIHINVFQRIFQRRESGWQKCPPDVVSVKADGISHSTLFVTGTVEPRHTTTQLIRLHIYLRPLFVA